MKILIDECLPIGIKAAVSGLGHECESVREVGLGSKKNGELLAIADAKWDVLLTSDRNIRYQQNMRGRKICVLILMSKSNRLPDLLPLLPALAASLLSAEPGTVREITLD
jgi:predicted nuclease of predicted toxin-antitoxin system